jgi:hypothetical protein
VRAFALVVVLAVAGCGRGSAARPDLADTTGVPCAGSECAPCADQFCDTADFGKTGTCRAHVAAMYQSFGCDGPEDCGAQGALGVCCMLEGIGSACSLAGCDSANGGIFMCHVVSDCAPGEKCCPLASGTTYSACRSSC